MTQCNPQIPLKRLDGREFVAAFDGGEMSSDGGAMLLSEIDQQLGLTDALASAVDDDRQQGKTKHSMQEMIAQRVYQIGCGYEDCNDSDVLRNDPLLKTAIGRLPEYDPLASAPTICRLENSITSKDLRRMGDVFIDLFIAAHSDGPPQQIVLDFNDSRRRPPPQCARPWSRKIGIRRHYRQNCRIRR